ncbi:hypothetical protein NE659_27730, partial [Flavonifractor plautii]|nr:hypothetical protein [Flavonifractor plautii]
RLFEGIVSTLSVEDNIALSNAKQMAKGPFVSGAAVHRQAKHWIGELRIKTPGPQALLRQLSGGTSQEAHRRTFSGLSLVAGGAGVSGRRPGLTAPRRP